MSENGTMPEGGLAGVGRGYCPALFVLVNAIFVMFLAVWRI